MITDRLRSAVDRAAQLPPETKDALASALEQALDAAVERAGVGAATTPPPILSPEVRDAFEHVLERHAASLAYLKDR
jgi:hypothetical protein